MKIRITNYTFDKTAKTVTFSDYTSIDLDSMLLITNVTDNIIIYNFADPLLGGTVLNNVLTLTYDTSLMSNTDKLQIFYEDGIIEPTLEEIMLSLNEESVWLLRRLVKMMESNTVVDANMRQKVIVEQTVWPTSQYHYGPNGMSAAASNNAPYSYAANNVLYYQPTWSGPIDPRYTNFDLSRMAYNGLRSKLVWS